MKNHKWFFELKSESVDEEWSGNSSGNLYERIDPIDSKLRSDDSNHRMAIVFGGSHRFGRSHSECLCGASGVRIRRHSTFVMNVGGDLS